MDLPVVGAAWPEEQDDLVAMAQILGVAVRISALPKPARRRRAR